MVEQQNTTAGTVPQGNPFFRSLNQSYGEGWQSSGGANPMHLQETPEYKDLGEREIALRNSLRTYKHEVLKEMRENGELDTQIYEKVKKDMATVKKESAAPRDFPSLASQIKYPDQGINVGSLLYRTTNMTYGNAKPSQQDLPTKYFPRPESYTNTFLGGNFSDTGLNTFKTPSRVHQNYDQ